MAKHRNRSHTDSLMATSMAASKNGRRHSKANEDWDEEATAGKNSSRGRKSKTQSTRKNKTSTRGSTKSKASSRKKTTRHKKGLLERIFS